jgi:hypothetical protein
MQDLETLRTALIITLGILVLVLAFRRFKQFVLAKDMPAPLHAEVLTLTVAYHPARLFVELAVPEPQNIHFALLDAQHSRLYDWNDQPAQGGRYALELMLPNGPDGAYYLEMSTATQRTVRQFRLQQ